MIGRLFERLFTRSNFRVRGNGRRFELHQRSDQHWQFRGMYAAKLKRKLQPETSRRNRVDGFESG